ncbi:MAG: sorbosone dehydrogenase family protein [Rhodospirillaceae bacterium]
MTVRTIASIAAVLVVCSTGALAQHLDQEPGTVISVDLNNLPAPYATANASNGSRAVPLPPLPQLRVPAGFAVNMFARVAHARSMRVAGDGTVFLAESGPGRITILRDSDGDGRADVNATFAQGFRFPHGMAFHGNFLYVADLDAVWRVPYTPGATAASGPHERVTAQGALGDAGGHVTRNLVIDPGGAKMYVAIGSRGNIDEEPSPRATIQQFNLDGSGQRTFAGGLRNPVGLAFRPGTNEIFTAVNERDGLGDELVPDYLTSVQDNGFYGWPYSYMGSRPQPRPGGWSDPQAQALIARAITPDLPIRSHSAPLGFAFYDKTSFPAAYRGGAFIALHGSWNAAEPRGYMVVYAPFAGGRPTGSYQVFLSNFWTATDRSAQVIGRPADVAVAADGALLVADDGSQTIWRVAHTGANLRFTAVPASGAASGESFLRFYNRGPAAGAVTATFRNGATGELLSTWTSPAIAPHASEQFWIWPMQAGAVPSLANPPATEFTIDVRADFDGFAQYLQWDIPGAALANMSRCEGSSSDGHVLLNVHSHNLAPYASFVRIHNGSGAARAPRLVIREASGGAELATWTAPTIANLATLEVSMAEIEAKAAPPLSATSVPHYVVALESGFVGALSHIVRLPAGNRVEFTEKCDLVAQGS